MIFLTVGNWHKGFDRLARAVDELVERDLINEEIRAQIGHGSYTPRYLNYTDYYSPSEFVDIVTKSRLIITHAGIGTIAQAIELAKPIIVVPRRTEFGECNDNHQWTTAKQLEKEGKVLVVYEVAELADKLRQASNFVPNKKQSGQKIVEAVEVFLEKLAAKKYNSSDNG